MSRGGLSSVFLDLRAVVTIWRISSSERVRPSVGLLVDRGVVSDLWNTESLVLRGG